jgi:hypothetical protein
MRPLCGGFRGDGAVTRKAWSLSAVAVLIAATVITVVVTATAHHPAAAAQGTPPSTAPVEQGRLSDRLSQYGTLTYRARPDGSPYQVINQASGTYTVLPTAGEKVGCGDVLYRVDDHPVLLLCGPTPVYRSLSPGERGRDVAELNANLVHLGYATRTQLNPSAATFGSATAFALDKLKSKVGEQVTGSLALGQAVILPGPVRIAAVTGQLGGPAQRGAPVASATSDSPQVQVALDPTYQDAVRKGDRARITLPNNTTVTGRVTRVGAVTQAPPTGQNGQSVEGQNATTAATTIPVSVGLDRAAKARAFDRAPVQVTITTRAVENALSVPVTAIVAHAGGGFAVEIVRADGHRNLIAVTLGLFDDAAGRVQVDGDLHPGDHVVVPSS